MPMKTLVEALDLRSKVLQNFERALNTMDLVERETLKPEIGKQIKREAIAV